jgi:hypothetical protein
MSYRRTVSLRGEAVQRPTEIDKIGLELADQGDRVVPRREILGIERTAEPCEAQHATFEDRMDLVAYRRHHFNSSDL